MIPAHRIELRTSVINKAFKLMSRRYPENIPGDTRIGLLGEFAVAEYLRQQGFTVEHRSVSEMRFAEIEGVSDLVYRDFRNRSVNVQVKSTSKDTCWIHQNCLKAYLCRNVDEIYFVDVRTYGYKSVCHIYHMASPQEIRRSWRESGKNRLSHPALHLSGRKYTEEETEL